jgi:hypothetical protein
MLPLRPPAADWNECTRLELTSSMVQVFPILLKGTGVAGLLFGCSNVPVQIKDRRQHMLPLHRPAARRRPQLASSSCPLAAQSATSPSSSAFRKTCRPGVMLVMPAKRRAGARLSHSKSEPFFSIVAVRGGGGIQSSQSPARGWAWFPLPPVLAGDGGATRRNLFEGIVVAACIYTLTLLRGKP